MAREEAQRLPGTPAERLEYLLEKQRFLAAVVHAHDLEERRRVHRIERRIARKLLSQKRRLGSTSALSDWLSLSRYVIAKAERGVMSERTRNILAEALGVSESRARQDSAEAVAQAIGRCPEIAEDLLERHLAGENLSPAPEDPEDLDELARVEQEMIAYARQWVGIEITLQTVRRR